MWEHSFGNGVWVAVVVLWDDICVWVLRMDFRQTALCVMDFKTNTAIM